MNSLTYRKIVNGLAVFVVVIVMLMPDTIFEWVTELFHFILESLLELADILFEWVESALDHVVEHLFETDLHDTQIIVFYIIMSGVTFAAYRLLRLLPGFYNRLVDDLIVAMEVNKVRAYMYWYSLTLVDKIKLLTVGVVVIFGYVFLGM